MHVPSIDLPFISLTFLAITHLTFLYLPSGYLCSVYVNECLILPAYHAREKNRHGTHLRKREAMSG